MSNMDTVWLILAAAAATYVTRFGGYILISRLRTLPPRLEAALNAVPPAVLTTLFAPAFVTGGWDVKIALLAAFAASFRFPSLAVLAIGWAAAMAARHGLGL